MENEQDLVVFEDDEGNELTMEVLDYFFYEGQEFALLAEVGEDDEACGEETCGEDGCEGCEHRDVYVMKVVPVGEDEEEFIPVDEALAETLLGVIESGLYDEEDAFDDEDDEDDEDEDDEE
jgi:hypothetical protein